MRRLSFLLLVAGCTAWPSMTHAVSRQPNSLRRLRLGNAHTGDTFDGAYRDDEGPIKVANLGVIDFLADVLDAVGVTKATILSPYGTAETNAMLAHITFSVAEHSQHILGRALDFRLESRLFDAMTKAQAMQRRGIGWYPHSGFIHIDTGPIRNWTLDERGPDYLLIFDGQQGSTEPAKRSLVAHGGRLPRYHNSSSSGSSPGQYRAAGYA